MGLRTLLIHSSSQRTMCLPTMEIQTPIGHHPVPKEPMGGPAVVLPRCTGCPRALVCVNSLREGLMTWSLGFPPSPGFGGLALSSKPGILGIFPGCSAEVARREELQVVPKNREPRSERAFAKRVGMSGPAQEGPQGTKAPPQTTPTSGPGDTLRCPSKTISTNLHRGKNRGIQNSGWRERSHRAVVWEGALQVSSVQKMR